MSAQPIDRAPQPLKAQAEGNEGDAEPERVKREQHRPHRAVWVEAAVVKIAARTGPMQGTQPKANAIPSGNAP